MSVEDITIGDPFFSVKLIKSKKNIFVNGNKCLGIYNQ